jgi:hypothetical protein
MVLEVVVEVATLWAFFHLQTEPGLMRERHSRQEQKEKPKKCNARGASFR